MDSDTILSLQDWQMHVFWLTPMNSRPNATAYDVGADHTISRSEWRDQVTRWTIEWLRAW